MKHLLATFALALLAIVSSGVVYADVVDVSGKVVIQKSGLVFNRQTNTYDTTLAIRNISADEVLLAPMQLVVSGLPAGVALQNASGSTTGALPYTNVVMPGGSLVPGAQVTGVVLKFRNTGRVQFAPLIQAFSSIADGKFFSNSGGGYSLLIPPELMSKYDDKYGTLLLHRPQPRLESPTITVSVYENPQHLALAEYFNGVHAPNILAQSGNMYSMRLVAGYTSYEFVPFVTESGTVIVVVSASDRFIVVQDNGAAFQANGLFQRVLASLSVGG